MNPFSLLTISEGGPSVPLLATLISDMRSFMSEPVFPRAGSEMMLSLREVSCYWWSAGHVTPVLSCDWSR